MRTLALVLVLLPLSAARTETIVVESVEWRTVAVPLVVAGKVVACSDVQPASGGLFRDVTIAVEEKFKGSVDGKTVTFRIQIEPGEEYKVDAYRSGSWRLGYSLCKSLRRSKFRLYADLVATRAYLLASR